MDLSKLNADTPAPWRTYLADRGRWILQDANGEYIATFEIKEAAEHAALARNAFDVMMRRGWYAVRNEDGWFVRGGNGQLTKAGYHDPATAFSSDPFTALVEADKWFKENVEYVQTEVPECFKPKGEVNKVNKVNKTPL